VQRFFIKKLHELSNFPFRTRPSVLNIESLEYSGLIDNLHLYYKVQHIYRHVDTDVYNALYPDRSMRLPEYIHLKCSRYNVY
jgi:hypothetical protein